MEPSPLTCHDVAHSSYVERFLARTLPDSDGERFESHFLTCDHCQQALTLGAATRASMRNTKGSATATDAGRSRASPFRWWRTPLTMAAAVLVVVFGYRANTVSSRALLSSHALQPFGAIAQAPLYLGLPVRAGDADRGVAQFDVAMLDYSAARWVECTRGLRAAIAAGKSDAPTHFFLGAALLMHAQSREAITEFTAVIDGAPSPYTDEALFYRAKAHLQSNNGAAAIADLTRLVAPHAQSDATGDTEIARHARALRDSLEAVGLR